ncbi:MAG: SsrA-binding protein SmpB [Dehalococcoidia bacterium]
MKQNKILITNKKANFDYDISETIEAGLVLNSSEIKSIRENRVNLTGSYAYPMKGELWLHNMHIAPYPFASNPGDPMRSRKLLLHKKELKKYIAASEQNGSSIVPLKMYVSGHYAKVLIGIGKGRKNYDKRNLIKTRDQEKEARSALKRESQTF